MSGKKKSAAPGQDSLQYNPDVYPLSQDSSGRVEGSYELLELSLFSAHWPAAFC